ncbi:hypothetical protein Bhyg_00627 [Pseudolycoriella hygida]|uniref:Uncharacterized protein n=1 Tax=Pseudolycoriella hygida TaxID=35572 RepID=A0A9Q0N9J3_9DIPT|nr:hypothetical protein Bhyg_00627 [Pseudolycoriella hygida]
MKHYVLLQLISPCLTLIYQKIIYLSKEYVSLDKSTSKRNNFIFLQFIFNKKQYAFRMHSQASYNTGTLNKTFIWSRVAVDSINYKKAKKGRMQVEKSLIIRNEDTICKKHHKLKFLKFECFSKILKFRNKERTFEDDFCLFFLLSKTHAVSNRNNVRFLSFHELFKLGVFLKRQSKAAIYTQTLKKFNGILSKIKAWIKLFKANNQYCLRCLSRRFKI